MCVCVFVPVHAFLGSAKGLLIRDFQAELKKTIRNNNIIIIIIIICYHNYYYFMDVIFRTSVLVHST